MQHGTILILTPHTKVPHRVIKQRNNVSLDIDTIAHQRVAVLTIMGAEAHFSPGGRVSVMLQGEGNFKPTFLPEAVLEIRDLKHNELERNHHLCQQCFTLTGTRLSHDRLVGTNQLVAKFRCTHCQREWVLSGITLLY